MPDFLLKLITLIGFLLSTSAQAYTPEAERVVDNVYAIVGPLEQRSPENDGLNNNQGFIVTDKGVILIDSGASVLGAAQIEQAIKSVTKQPVKWVINTGSQDHRWLGNDYFASRGAEVIALKRTVETQHQYAEQQMSALQRFLGNRLEGTKPFTASRVLNNSGEINLAGQKLVITYTDAHFPGDAWVWLPQQRVVFAGDLVYLDRLIAILPWSSVRNGQKAFKAMEKLNAQFIVPGHGRVCDPEMARKVMGAYYDFLNDVIGYAATELEPMDEIIDKYSSLPAFEQLVHFNDLHRTNMNRTYLEFESME